MWHLIPVRGRKSFLRYYRIYRIYRSSNLPSFLNPFGSFPRPWLLRRREAIEGMTRCLILLLPWGQSYKRYVVRIRSYAEAAGERRKTRACLNPLQGRRSSLDFDRGRVKTSLVKQDRKLFLKKKRERKLAFSN